MPTLWNSLYCRSEHAATIAEALRESLSALGYELYNPFGRMPGKAYRQSVRLFAAPAAAGWVRVIGDPDERQLGMLSQTMVCLNVALESPSPPTPLPQLEGRNASEQISQAKIEVYANGQKIDAPDGLTPYLRAGRTADELQKILAGDAGIIGDVVEENVGTQRAASLQPTIIPLDALPKDVQALAKGVNPAQAQKLFSRLSGDVLKKFSGDSAQVEGARALVSGGGEPDWNSLAGRQIRALMACLTVPENWREPDFVTLRDAYPLYERRSRNPNARLYPGDEVTMAQVPNALDYVPVYGGRN